MEPGAGGVDMDDHGGEPSGKETVIEFIKVKNVLLSKWKNC